MRSQVRLCLLSHCIHRCPAAPRLPPYFFYCRFNFVALFVRSWSGRSLALWTLIRYIPAAQMTLCFSPRLALLLSYLARHHRLHFGMPLIRLGCQHIWLHTWPDLDSDAGAPIKRKPILKETYNDVIKYTPNKYFQKHYCGSPLFTIAL